MERGSILEVVEGKDVSCLVVQVIERKETGK